MKASTSSGTTRRSRRRLGAALSTMAVTAAAAGAGLVPASATVGPAGIAPGINITVFHNIDFVATFGWDVGQSVTVQVLRNDVVIGSATGPAVETPEGGALEVNHGPEGAPQPGDCWEGHTPDVRPGDLIRVTGGGSTSEVIVDNITMPGPATLNTLTQDVEVRGVAQTAAGAAIPPTDLDSGEFRDVLPEGQFRATPDEIVSDPDSAVPGAFVMRYHSPYVGDVKDPAGASLEDRRQSLLETDGHAIGFGHVAPLPDEAMLVEGFGDTPGPALGCEGSPTATHAIGAVSPSRINLSNATSGVTVSGVSASDTVTVNLSDGGDPVSGEAAVTGGTWTVLFSAAQLAALDGTVTVTATHDPDGGAAAQNTRTFVRDVVAPAAPTVSPNGGAISGPSSVFITGGGGERLFYTLGNGSQPAPAMSGNGAVSGTQFTGPFNVAPGQTVKAIAVDAADNVSGVTTTAFTQAASTPAVPPPANRPGAGTAAVIPLAPAIGNATSGKRGGNDTATARWRAPAANGAVLDGYEVRALRIRPGKPAKIRPAVSVGSGVQKLKMALPAGKYKFQVRAVSNAGKSPWSERSAKVTAR